MKNLFLIFTLLFTLEAFGARKEYGNWKRTSDGCYLRHEILREQAIELHDKKNKCNYNGIWEDFYTGKRLNDVGQIDIDHVLSVSEFDKKCRKGRGRDYRRKFYNDKDNLVVSDKDVNKEKSDKSKKEYVNEIKDLQRREAYIRKYDLIWNRYCK